MSTYRTQLVGREDVATGTVAFHFAKPAGFAFKPGQAIDLILPQLAGGDGQADRHAFSLVSAPSEDRLSIATRMRDSAFKRTLAGLAAGAPVDVDGPFGALTLHKDRARPALFVAGGIGITPFMCMLRHAAQEGTPRRIVLVYSNRRPEDAAFLEELQGLEKILGGFRLLPTMTQASAAAQPWNGRTGAIDAPLLCELVVALASPVCYVVGPPAMVESMRQRLNEIGVDDDDIRSEDFFGY